MPTKTFSGRAEMSKLAYAESMTEREHGMSYGQYCSSILLDHICAHHALPDVRTDESQEQRRKALEQLRVMKERLRDSRLATMSDEEIKKQIASRYV